MHTSLGMCRQLHMHYTAHHSSSHTQTHTAADVHACTHTIPPPAEPFWVFFSSSFSQYSEPTDPPTCRRCPSSFTKASSSSSRQLAVLVFSPPKAALCVWVWIWPRLLALAHKPFTRAIQWLEGILVCVCVFVYWGHHWLERICVSVNSGIIPPGPSEFTFSGARADPPSSPFHAPASVELTEFHIFWHHPRTWEILQSDSVGDGTEDSVSILRLWMYPPVWASQSLKIEKNIYYEVNAYVNT